MPRWIRLAVLLLAAFAAAEWWSTRAPVEEPPVEEPSLAGQQEPSRAGADASARYPSFLPPEAVSTLQAIERGGPFPYDRDGTVFQNRERRLPEQPRGYYREYTVVTPGSRDRGARRIVAGGQPPEVYYYTDDHYRTFRPVEVRQ
jgi:guanyl-specific ribonuclease Sa